MKKKEEKTVLDLIENEDYYEQKAQDDAFFISVTAMLAAMGLLLLLAYLFGKF